MTLFKITLITTAYLVLTSCGAAEPGSSVGEPAGDAAASIVRGEALIEQGAFEEAAEMFERLLVEDPKNAKAHYYLGLCRENLGGMAAAIESYRKALGLDPNLAEAHNNLGNLLLAEGDLAGAEPELAVYLEQHPDESGAHYNYGLVLEEMGKLAQAREHYDKAIELDPEDPAPLVGVADLTFEGGDPERALELYRKARVLDVNDPMPLLREGQALLELKRVDEAATALEGLTEVSGADASLLTSAGIITAQNGKPDVALELYRGAVERDDTFALAHFKLANALGRKQEFEQAATHFERFLELAPDDPLAEAAKKGLAACREKSGQ
ncbi:MAG: tetratricopeptide repeat protein [Deltaproteobacteria bacterium]|nr:tetratricopeptide repeat protein [Deltaproteobacteria bacterium]